MRIGDVEEAFLLNSWARRVAFRKWWGGHINGKCRTSSLLIVIATCERDVWTSLTRTQLQAGGGTEF